jgi:ribulose-5-phosphate 4-epimerase/fuculose-1-phosphate aldolase
MKTVLIGLLMSCALLAQPAATSKALGAAGQASKALIDELVLANRILSNEGVLDAYGHVSVRSDRDHNHFFLARHLPAGVVAPADMIEYDLDTKPVVQSDYIGYSERFIHGEIYKARPDVMAIVHGHAPEIVAFSVTSVPLLPIAHMAAFLIEGVPNFEIRKAGGVTDMLIRTNELGRALAQTLGDKPAALLRGHGAVVVGPSLHVVAGRAYYMNANARELEQALLLGGGEVTYLEREEARKAAPQDGFERAWELWKRRAMVTASH